jgi:hypothetical protein
MNGHPGMPSANSDGYRAHWAVTGLTYRGLDFAGIHAHSSRLSVHCQIFVETQRTRDRIVARCGCAFEDAV